MDPLSLTANGLQPYNDIVPNALKDLELLALCETCVFLAAGRQTTASCSQLRLLLPAILYDAPLHHRHCPLLRGGGQPTHGTAANPRPTVHVKVPSPAMWLRTRTAPYKSPWCSASAADCFVPAPVASTVKQATRPRPNRIVRSLRHRITPVKANCSARLTASSIRIIPGGTLALVSAPNQLQRTATQRIPRKSAEWSPRTTLSTPP